MSEGEILPEDDSWERRDAETEARIGVDGGTGVLAREREQAREVGAQEMFLGATDPARDTEGLTPS